MIEVTDSAVIHSAPERVFAVAADPQEQLKWDPGTLRAVEKLSSGPLAKGSRYRGDFKGYGTVEYDYTDFDPPRTFSHRATMKMGRMSHTFQFEAIPEGTRLNQVGRLEPNLLGRIMAPMLKAGLRKRFREIAAELDAYTT